MNRAWTAALVVLALANTATVCRAAEFAPLPEPWFPAVSGATVSSPPPTDDGEDLRALKALIAARKPADLARSRWWLTGGPGYRWNELALEALFDELVTMPMAARHLALINAAIDDAVAAAGREKRRFMRPRPTQRDGSIQATAPVPASSGYPSDYAAAAAAAAGVLAELLPRRAQTLAAQAEEAMRAPLLAGLEFTSDMAAGREIGRAVAARAVARAKADGADAKWSGVVPSGPGLWQGANPAAPAAAGWRPWLLARPDEFRPAPPPAVDSPLARADLAEVKAYARTPRSTHLALYWEAFGGARGYVFWNDRLRQQLLERAGEFEPATATRAMAALNIALADAGVACWDAKYAYWYPRPSQLDAELKTVFPNPSHPSYPSAHSCYSLAAATVLAAVFPEERERLAAQAKEAGEARIWAGIHYRFDLDAGAEIGRRVAERVLARAFSR